MVVICVLNIRTLVNTICDNGSQYYYHVVVSITAEVLLPK